MAAESYDPLGALYSSDGYAVADGTSFATPLVTGAAALVKQSHPGFTSAQVKSALVNTASQDVTTDDAGDPVDVQWLGAGKLDAGAAAGAMVTADPVSIAFGVLASKSLPKTEQFRITNSGANAVTLAIGVAARSQSSGAKLALDKQSLSLAPGASGTVSVTLSGSVPAPGSYSGAITLQGSGVSLRVPYLYLVGSGVPANIIPLTGDNFDGTVGEGIPDGIISFKLTDAFGVPVSGVPVGFSARDGGVVVNADSATDNYGIAAAQPALGAAPGSYSFLAAAGSLRYTFSGTARPKPNMTGFAAAANLDTTTPAAPGSFITISGTGFSDTSDYATSTVLPLAIDYVNVSFDVPSEGISLPGRLISVSPNQVTVQVPWELQGKNAAQVKVTIDYSNGNVVSVPLADYAPAVYEVTPGMASALDVNNNPIGANNPAQPGQVIHLAASGLGPVTNQPASGDPAPSSPLAQTTTAPVVTIGGEQADVSFSGLMPGIAGVYQIDITVPSDLSTGAYPVQIAIGGQTSRPSNLSVQ